MARLPEPYSLAVTPQASRPIAQVDPRAAGAVGGAIAGLGQDVTEIGQRWQDIDDTAAAKERDAYVSDQIRKLLYDPTTGFTNLNGKAAVAARGSVSDQIKAIREAAGKDLSPNARRKLEARLQERIDRAEMTVDTHTGGQRQVWLEGAGRARIEAAEQDALLSDGNVAEPFKIIAEELHQRAKREGWDAAVLDLELSKAKSSLLSNQAVKIAQTNPELAIEYLDKNANELTPKDLLNLKSKLEPLAKEYRGRRLGAEAALVGVDPGYLASIKAAESGGNPNAKNPLSSATGLYQFTSGTWATMMGKHPELGLTADGRTDPMQQEVAIRAFTADNARTLESAGIPATGGNLYAAHFLGAGGAIAALRASGSSAMSDVVGADVIDANPFLANMTVDGFRKWTAAKGGGTGVAYSPNAQADVASLMAIKDPDVRAAAIEEFTLRQKVAANQQKARMDAATNAAFQHVEAGNDPGALPLDVRQALGMESMSALRTYYGKTEAERVTDDAAYLELRDMQASDPAGFRNLNILTYADRLSSTDIKGFIDDQKKPADSATNVAASTLMSIAKNQMEAAGIDTTGKPGSDAVKQSSAMQSRLLRWQTKFISENGRAPTPTEIDERIGQELLPVALNPRGPFNERDGFVFEVPEVAPEKLAETGITIGGREVPPAVVQEQIAAMEAAGEEVTSTALVQRLAALMEGL